MQRLQEKPLHRSASVLEPLQDRLRTEVMCLCIAGSYYTNAVMICQFYQNRLFSSGHISQRLKRVCVYLFFPWAQFSGRHTQILGRERWGHCGVLPSPLKRVSLV